MRLDYRFGRPMELDAIFTNPIAAAAAAGIKMPLVGMMLQQLRFLNERNLQASA
jgi:2-dehydropantoate 2-reductase